MDWNAAANVSVSRAKAAASVDAATCRKCGCTSVAWVVSKKTGKSYLAEAIFGTPGKVIPLPYKPHFLNCGKGTSTCWNGCGCKTGGTS